MMTTTDILNIILDYSKFALFAVCCILVYRLGKFIINIIDEKEKKKAENEKLKLYASIDPKLVKQELILLIKDYTARYMTKNIMVNHIDFIKNDQIDAMVKSIVKDTVLDMSDMYLSYCKLLYNVSDEDDLLKVIYYLTVDVVLDAVTEFNKTLK